MEQEKITPPTIQKEVRLVQKTESKKDTEEICYYTTEDDMFVPGSLSFNEEEAERFFHNYVAKNGNLVEITTLQSAPIQKQIWTWQQTASTQVNW